MHNYTCPIGEGMGISSLKTLGKMNCMVSTKNKEDTASKSMGFLLKLYILVKLFIFEIMNTIIMFLIQRLIYTRTNL